MIKVFDVIILGAGAAGLMCALTAGRRGRRVVVLDHGRKIGRKVLVSGGGRCNFTNRNATPDHYLSSNPHFCKSALSRYTPDDFIAMVKDHGIPFHEKKLGQLFCNGSARQIVEMLVAECRKVAVDFRLGIRIERVEKEEGFIVHTDQGDFTAPSLVVATGGLSLPKLGATDLGYRIARQFGPGIVPPSPALDGFAFTGEDLRTFRTLSGVSMEVTLTCEGVSFREAILFTHAGLSGPAALQGSLYWKPGSSIEIDLLPDHPILEWFLQKKKEGSRAEVKNLLSRFWPKRFSETFCEVYFPHRGPLAEIPDKSLRDFAKQIHHWTIAPAGTVGYGQAEVTRGGVDTADLSSRTMEARQVPGIYFIGEVVDVTGQLGGYNFQWAWSSGWAAGNFA